MKKIVMEELSISFDEFLIMLIAYLGINLIDSVLIITTGFECIS